MSVEFIDTNVLVYAHNGGAGVKHEKSVQLLKRLFTGGIGALSIQVLTEFYWVGTRKFEMKSQECEDIIGDLGSWTIHRPFHADLIRAAGLHRRYKMSWWDALIVNSAVELGCEVLWSEDLAHGQQYESVTVRNPFA